ncbi:HAD family hydrolase [Symbioplanes lichenis]|uniref:HAD family hydrolase n=1 Tax=Symbioplanes lichenis TaxID=1629072 RepID=UPI002739579F|nr:haloacid dehalogenase [Actinoplanes lichenis]
MTTFVLDTGETIVDETEQWFTWAKWMDVPPFTLIATLGGLLERGRPFKEVFAVLRPGFDIDEEIERRRAAGDSVRLTRDTLHKDVFPAISALVGQGHAVLIAGNMTAAEQAELRALALPVDAVLSSADLGARSAEPRFFAGLAAQTGPGTVFVSHRLDTTGKAAARAGMPYLYLERGPIAMLRKGSRIGLDSDPVWRGLITTLTELPDRGVTGVRERQPSLSDGALPEAGDHPLGRRER